MSGLGNSPSSDVSVRSSPSLISYLYLYPIICLHVYKFVYIYIYLYILSLSLYIYMYVYVYVCVYVYVYLRAAAPCRRPQGCWPWGGAAAPRRTTARHSSTHALFAMERFVAVSGLASRESPQALRQAISSHRWLRPKQADGLPVPILRRHCGKHCDDRAS